MQRSKLTQYHQICARKEIKKELRFSAKKVEEVKCDRGGDVRFAVAEGAIHSQLSC